MALSRRVIILIILSVDLLALNVSYGLISIWHYSQLVFQKDLFYLLNISWALTFTYTLNQRFFKSESIRERLFTLLKKIGIYLFIGSFTIVVLNLDDISRTMFLGSTLIFFTLKVLLSFPYYHMITHREDGGYFTKILIVGANKIGEAIATFYRLNADHGHVIGFLDNSESVAKRYKVLGTLNDFQRVFDREPFNEVIIALDFDNGNTIKSLVEVAEYNGVRPGVVANFYSLFNKNFEIRYIAGIPTLRIREVPLESYIPRVKKRLFDIVFSTLVLIFSSPLLLLIALAIKLDSKGPVFYKPVRIGKKGDSFGVYKFRSMKHGHNDPSKSTVLNDPRITRVGKFLRKTSLDEFPQFINVFFGSMSVVGPRPHRIDLNKKFQVAATSYMVRQYIRPGITGWAQVNGWRGPTETKFQYVARTLHDLWYMEHWTFALDLYIIYLTIFGKKTRKNAF
jgi:putative colanic acid biosysnthesis UDP-glucose lipid carrier transferase